MWINKKHVNTYPELCKLLLFCLVVCNASQKHVITETQSDLSDFEGRIRALNEELRRRKTEADKLKRERKKKRKELMKNKEESLKKQIEVWLC